MDKAAEEEALKEVFAKYDVDGSGDISREELRSAARDYKLASTDAELDALLAMIDTDGDGRISFQEFITNSSIAKVLEIDSVGRLLELVTKKNTVVEFHAPFCRTCRNMRGRCVCVSLCLCVSMCVCVCVSVSVSIPLSVSVSVSVSVSLSLSVSVSVSLCVCVCVCVCVCGMSRARM